MDPDRSEDVARTEETAASPGLILRRAREQSGWSLSEASKETSIWERHLQALEGDAAPEEFPAPVYARAFLREYAEFLQVEPEPLLREFDARHTGVEEPSLELLPDTRGRGRVVASGLALLSAAALILIALMGPASPPPSEPGPAFPARNASVEVHDSWREPPASPATTKPRGLWVVLRVVEPCWVNAVSDGEVVALHTLLPGKTVVYRADHHLQLRLGNAGGVRLRVNDEPVPTGSSGEVVTFDFEWQRDRVDTARD